jgi:HEAT repeat protein
MSGSARAIAGVVVVVALLLAGVGLWYPRPKREPAQALVKELPPDAGRRHGDEADDGYIPPKPADPDLAKLVDRKAPMRERLHPDMASRFTQIAYEEDVPLVVGVLKDVKDDDNVRNEAANYLRRAKYPKLAEVLIEVLDNPQETERFRAFAAQHLWEEARKREGAAREQILAKLRALTEDRHVAVRREALWGLVCLGDESGKETAVKWLEAEGPEAGEVRDLAIRCVQEKLNLREKIPAVRKFLKDSDETIRIQAMVSLSQWGDEESREAFAEAASSRMPRIKGAGEVALKRLDAVKKQAEQKATQKK